MTARRLLPAVLLLAVAGGAVYVWQLRREIDALRRTLAQQAAAPARPAATAPPRTAMSSLPRTLSDEQRTALLTVLREEASTERAAWIQVDERNPEALAYAKTLEDAFREAGWKVERRDAEGMVFKAGLHMLVADEAWPAYTDTAHRAFEQAGIPVATAASGYRDYYRQQRAERPGWLGPRIRDDQTWLLVVGPNPAS